MAYLDSFDCNGRICTVDHSWQQCFLTGSVRMCEVVRSNFEERFPDIEQNLKEATFIAVDTEFTGGISNVVQSSKPSLFDSASDRYTKLRQNVEGCIIVQMGLTTFRFHRDENKYVATTYNFYLFPKPFASVDVKFVMQSSSIDFLCRHGFDFNKFMYEGVPYLNRPQVRQLQSEMANGSLMQHVERSLVLEEERLVQQECSRVCEWKDSAVLGDQLVLDVLDDTFLSYLLHWELRTRFLCIWTFTQAGQVHVIKVSESERIRLEEQERQESTMDQQFLQSALGFSKVFALLINLKKPIVGHNVFMDLMFMYNQFHEPLPAQYWKFKQKITELFPTVFDTKYVSFELKKELRKEDKWVSNILEEMYTYFKEAQGKELVLYSPLVESTNGFNSSDFKKRFHEAGWDSYCTGFCFIKMAHILASTHYSRHGYPRPLTSTEHFAAVSRMKGCINIIRANVSHVCLLGDDPQSSRPRLLHVSAKGPKVINSSELAALFAAFGAVDVRLCSRRRAMVAVGTHKIARDVLSSFKGHKDLEVSLYSPLRHSSLVRGLLWSGLVTSMASCAWLIMKSLSKN